MATIKVENHGRVTLVSLSRPEVRNAVNGATAAALTCKVRWQGSTASTVSSAPAPTSRPLLQKRA